jgi:hypothetical protein
MTTRVILGNLNLLDQNGGSEFGPLPQAIMPDEILYYKLQVTKANWNCIFIEGSGSFTQYSSISDFIGRLVNHMDLGQRGALPTDPQGPTTAPSMVVRKKCYVVIDLSSDDESSLCFWAGHPQIKTIQDCSAKYLGLSGTTDSGGRCRVIYFAVPNPLTSGGDPFNLYLQFDQGSDVVTKTIDPAIKNRGGSGSGGMAPSGVIL